MKKIFILLSLNIFILITLSINLFAVTTYYNSSYYTVNIPTNYYNDVDETKTGSEFREILGGIISKNFVHHSYKDNNEVLKYTDPDPNNNGNIICFYTGQSLSSGSWNKEHVWAKSHGFPTSSSNPYCDAHHLRPTLNSINSSRSNSDFGEVDNLSGVKSDNYGNKWTSSIFEPRDEVKGDVARIMFYMATRYGYESPYNLTLVNNSTTSTSQTNGEFGGLQTLLKWHYNDPVSKEEIYRNNVIYDKYQKNRNPYIDHPEYVDLAYPNQYANTTIDQAKVDNVIFKIESLPELITNNEKALVEEAYTLYEELNYKEKELITNYDKLESALKVLDIIEEPTKPIEPEDPENPSESITQSIELDFKNHGLKDISYGSNYSFSINNYNFTASNAGIYSNEFRIGHNKSDTDLSKYGIDSSGVVLESKFSIINLKKVSISILNSYGTINDVYLIMNDNEGYNIIGSTKYSKEISFDLNKAYSGCFLIAFSGTTPRVVIDKLSWFIENNNEEIPDVTNTKINASIYGEINDNRIINAKLQFWTSLDKNLLNEVSNYGMIITSNDYFDIYDYYDDGSFEELLTDLDYNNIRLIYYNFTNKGFENNEQYQFGISICNLDNQYDTKLTALLYFEIDGVLYFSESVTYSYSQLMQQYFTEEEIENLI